MSQQNLPAAQRPDQTGPTLTQVPPLTEPAHASLADVATPRLRAVEVDASRHAVPPTVRHAGTLPANTLALRHQALKRVGIAPTTPTTDEPAPEPPTLTVAPNPADATRDTGCTTLEPETPEPGTPEANRSQATPAPTPASQRTLATAPAATERALSLAPALDAGPASGAGGEAIDHTRGHGGPGVPDVRVWGGRLAQAVSEVLAGDRPISQLVRFTDDAVFAELNRRVRVLGMTTTATGRGAKERSAVRSVRVCCPAKDVAEVAAHVRHGYRSRAIALRLEIRRNRWVCTALELG